MENNLLIYGLCFLPFIMVILIYLHEQGLGIPFPENSTQLYNYFIYIIPSVGILPSLVIL